MARSGSDLRERIADAAAKILFHQGAKRLSQLEVAKALGIRQSHLTYYFPRRADLLAAVAHRFLAHASAELGALPVAGKTADAFVAELGRRMTAPGSLRAFFGLLIEADEDAELRRALITHLDDFSKLVARVLGRPPADPDVRLFVAALRGLAPECFLARKVAPEDVVVRIARRLELVAAPPRERRSPPRKRRTAAA